MRTKNELFMDAVYWLIDEGYASNQGDVAAKADLGPNIITRIKKGQVKEVSDDTIRALCNHFDMLNIDYLRGKSEHISKLQKPRAAFDAELLNARQPLSSEHSISTTKEENDNMLIILARMIRGIDDLRVQLKDELAEIKTVKSELQQASDDFRNAAYRLTQYLSTLPSDLPQIGIAADEPPTIKVKATPSTTSPRILRKKASLLLSDLDGYRTKSTPKITKNPKK